MVFQPRPKAFTEFRSFISDLHNISILHKTIILQISLFIEDIFDSSWLIFVCFCVCLIFEEFQSWEEAGWSMWKESCWTDSFLLLRGSLLHLDRPPLIFNQCHFLSTPQSRLLSVQNEDILQQKSSRRNNHCRKWKRDFHILGRIQPNIGLKNLNPIYHVKRTIFFIFGDL